MAKGVRGVGSRRALFCHTWRSARVQLCVVRVVFGGGEAIHKWARVILFQLSSITLVNLDRLLIAAPEIDNSES